MNTYKVIAGDTSFEHDFDGEPQINLTFEKEGKVYKVMTRAHDEHESEPTLHAEVV